ncbi:methylated-DNA--[protein]-cysteine S-methyltransferase [Pseudoalteromonas mariniglutinosa]|uniref:methylated-DNA--[protein]-cysteine S-methyltransferase n=1 Tax=Pseudoalteromonas mariniglutinosa TaxID=206042 RepID=UPI00384BF57B
MTIQQVIMPSPMADIIIQGTERGVCYLGFYPLQQLATSPLSATTHQSILLCIEQLNEYFAKQRQEFTVPLDTQGTPFQQAVWQALSDVPFGTVKSYGDIARTINKPKAVRAVGAANGKNPISIIVPCHRIIGANGKLTGYAGGIERKQWLLTHEGII